MTGNSKKFNPAESSVRQLPTQILTTLINETYARIPSTGTITNTRQELFLVLVEKDKATLLHPDKPEHILKCLNSTAHGFNHAIALSQKTGDSYCYVSPQQPQLKLLIINSASRLGLTNLEREHVFFYNHEFAHAAIENAHPTTSKLSINTMECIADAYAALRMYQRFGRNTCDVQAASAARAFNFAFKGVKAHFTSPVLEEIIAQNRTIDYATLTPQETMTLAYESAVRHAPKPEQMERLGNNFKGLLKNANKSNPDTLIKFAQGLLKTSSPQVFLYGSTALSAILSGQIKRHGEPVCLESPQWDDVREKLFTRMEKFKAQGALSGLNRLPKIKARAP